MIEVFESFAARQTGGGALTVTRTTSGVYDANGYSVDGTVTTLPIIAQVSPTTGRELQILADQGITGESRSLLTSTQLFARDSGFAPDAVTGVDLGGDGVPWIVFSWQRFTAADGDVFFHVIVARQALK